MSKSKRVIIAGAGAGGLHLAYLLGREGFNVDVYEKRSYDDLSYDWHDDVSGAFFTGLAREIELERCLPWRKSDMTFIFDERDSIVPTHIPENEREYVIERLPFAQCLADNAAGYADIHYGCEVTLPIVENGRVAGVMVNGEKRLADLVVDNLGAFSRIRTNLPPECGVENDADDENIAYAYRAVFDTATRVYPYTNKVYLRHLGGPGISWVNIDERHMADVIVVSLKPLSEEFIRQALDDLRANNPALGQNLQRGGEGICRIPVRRPLTKLFANGLAVIGDSAYMNLPLHGSGIEASIVAARCLFKHIKDGDFSEKAMYGWNYDFLSGHAAKFFELDLLRRFLLETDPLALKEMYVGKIIDADDFAGIYAGSSLNYNVLELIKKGITGIRSPSKLVTLTALYSKLLSVRKQIGLMPAAYDPPEFNSWREKTEEIFRPKVGIKNRIKGIFASV